MKRAIVIGLLALVAVNCHTTIAGCIGAIVCHNYPPPKPEPPREREREVPRISLWWWLM